jgi:hypothetical protein
MLLFMARTSKKTKRKIEDIELTTATLCLCANVVELMAQFHEKGERLRASILLGTSDQIASRVGVSIEGASEVFTNSAVQQGMLEIRRSLEFFGLKVDVDRKRKSTRPKITARGRAKGVPPPPNQKESFGIADFALPWVSRRDFLRVGNAVLGKKCESTIMRVHRWSNKRLAHFTHSVPSVSYGMIRDACLVMIAAHFKFVFDGLGASRPVLIGPCGQVVKERGI